MSVDCVSSKWKLLSDRIFLQHKRLFAPSVCIISWLTRTLSITSNNEFERRKRREMKRSDNDLLLHFCLEVIVHHPIYLCWRFLPLASRHVSWNIEYTFHTSIVWTINPSWEMTETFKWIQRMWNSLRRCQATKNASSVARESLNGRLWAWAFCFVLIAVENIGKSTIYKISGLFKNAVFGKLWFIHLFNLFFQWLGYAHFLCEINHNGLLVGCSDSKNEKGRQSAM